MSVRNHIGNIKAICVWLTAACAGFILWGGTVNAQSEPAVEVDIEAQDLSSALTAFGRQTKTEIAFTPDVVGSKLAPAVKGEMTRVEVMEKLLADTGLVYEVMQSDVLLVKAREIVAIGAADEQRGDSDSKNSQLTSQGTIANTEDNPEKRPYPTREDETEERRVRTREDVNADEEASRQSRGQIESIVVYGSRNTGIRRYEDDAQPYVIFDAAEIETSFAGSIEELLRARLPQNASFASDAQRLGEGNRSSFNLRGLGADQTLVLVNGRRQPNISGVAAEFGQPDINGIPISAVERIEVLPSTASGIYGGGATGGAINIILKRDYVGADLAISYDNTFESDVGQRRIDGSAGFALEGGRTNIFVTGGYFDSNTLKVGDRDFAERGRALLLQNDPSQFFAPGFTTNIWDLSGGELILDDGTPLGSPFTFVPVGYPGVATDGGAALVANAGQYNTDLPAHFSGATLLNSPTRRYGSINVRREFASWLELFAEYSIAQTESSSNGAATGGTDQAFIAGDAPGNPFQNFINVRYPAVGVRLGGSFLQETTNLFAGASVELPGEWAAQFEVGRSSSETDVDRVNQLFGFEIFGAIASGEVDVFSDLNAFPPDFSSFEFEGTPTVTRPADSELGTYSLRFSGPAFELPAGPIALSFLLERREQDRSDSFDSQAFLLGAPPLLRYGPPINQDVNSAYVEVLAPIVSSENSLPLLEELELQLAIRHDAYKTTADSAQAPPLVTSIDNLPEVSFRTIETTSTDFTVGVRYIPVGGLLLRASYGTGFLPPSVSQIGGSEDISSFVKFLLGPDPKRGGQTGTHTQDINVLSGGSIDLDPEQSESLSFGLRYAPRFLDGLAVSVDYTRIRKTSEIVAAFTTSNILDFEDLVPGIVTRLPLTSEDAALGYTAGEVIEIDERLVNVATSEVEAYDFQINYSVSTTDYGDFEVYGVATLQTAFERQIIPSTPTVDNVGFADGPLEWRGNLGANWHAGPWTLGWNAQYYDSYVLYSADTLDPFRDLAVARQGSDTIPSQNYHDLFVRYRFDDNSRFRDTLLASTELQIGILNAFDESPPIIATDGIGGYSALGDPRLRRYSIQVRSSF